MPQGKEIEEALRTAHHEAAHAVIGRVLKQRCRGASIAPNDEERAAGHAIVADPDSTYVWWDTLGCRSRGQHEYLSVVRGRIMTLMAGREAEEEFFGLCIRGDNEDQRQIERMFASYPDVARGAEPDQYPTLYDGRLRVRVRELVRRHRRTIERVAVALMDCETLEAAEIDQIMMATGRV